MNRILLDWMLACWIDNPNVGNGKYGWESFRIADYDTVLPGNRPGLDYTFEITTDPFSHAGDHMSSYQGKYYSVNESLRGSFRAGAAGLGDMRAFVYNETGGLIEEIDAGSANDVAISLPETGDVLLLCNSFSGLDLDVSAGSVISSTDAFTFYPQPCRGTLFFQFRSNGGNAAFSVFTISGGYVETVSYNSVASGEATLAYPGASNLASGTYFFRFNQGSRIETGSFAVVR
jgi:hypothetical protein